MPKHFFLAGIVVMSAARVAFAAETELAELTKRAETFCADRPQVAERTDCVEKTLSLWQSSEHIAMVKAAYRYAAQILAECKNDDFSKFRECSDRRAAKIPESAKELAQAAASLDNMTIWANLQEQRRNKILANCRRVGITKETARIGMTREMALKCGWGEPDKVNRTRTAGGVREQWVYSDGTYLYFDNGKLTAIQD